jgi:hypothetical protein
LDGPESPQQMSASVARSIGEIEKTLGVFADSLNARS